MKILAAILFDLEKAFDKVPRAKVWEILQEKAKMHGVTLFFQELHDGTCYLIKDKSGNIRKRVWVNQGVRQGSVEGPILFICLYDIIMESVRIRRENEGFEEARAHPRAEVFTCGDQRTLNVGEVAFVDDLISLLLFDRVEDLERWVEQVLEAFEEVGMKANISKLEFFG